MDLFQEQKQFVREIKDSINPLFAESVSQFDFVIRDFIVNKQLFQQGVDGNNEKLVNRKTGSRGYARITIQRKRRLGQPVDRITLHDKERFVGSIDIEARDGEFEVDSDVDYDKYIFDRYGVDVLKPSQENMTEFIENFFIPKLVEFTNTKLQ